MSTAIICNGRLFIRQRTAYLFPLSACLTLQYPLSGAVWFNLYRRTSLPLCRNTATFNCSDEMNVVKILIGLPTGKCVQAYTFCRYLTYLLRMYIILIYFYLLNTYSLITYYSLTYYLLLTSLIFTHLLITYLLNYYSLTYYLIVTYLLLHYYSLTYYLFITQLLITHYY
jgi:hypothetical protein